MKNLISIEGVLNIVGTAFFNVKISVKATAMITNVGFDETSLVTIKDSNFTEISFADFPEIPLISIESTGKNVEITNTTFNRNYGGK